MFLLGLNKETEVAAASAVRAAHPEAGRFHQGRKIFRQPLVRGEDVIVRDGRKLRPKRVVCLRAVVRGNKSGSARPQARPNIRKSGPQVLPPNVRD